MYLPPDEGIFRMYPPAQAVDDCEKGCTIRCVFWPYDALRGTTTRQYCPTLAAPFAPSQSFRKASITTEFGDEAKFLTGVRHDHQPDLNADLLGGCHR